MGCFSLRKLAVNTADVIILSLSTKKPFCYSSSYNKDTVFEERLVTNSGFEVRMERAFYNESSSFKASIQQTNKFEADYSIKI